MRQCRAYTDVSAVEHGPLQRDPGDVRRSRVNSGHASFVRSNPYGPSGRWTGSTTCRYSTDFTPSRCCTVLSRFKRLDENGLHRRDQVLSPVVVGQGLRLDSRLPVIGQRTEAEPRKTTPPPLHPVRRMVILPLPEVALRRTPDVDDFARIMKREDPMLPAKVDAGRVSLERALLGLKNAIQTRLRFPIHFCAFPAGTERNDNLAVLVGWQRHSRLRRRGSAHMRLRRRADRESPSLRA